MARRAFVPAELRQRPFTLSDAHRAGLERGNLRGTSWTHLGAGVYAWAGLPQTPWLVLSGIQMRLPEVGAFSGRTAGWIHGLDAPPLEPVEVSVPDDCALTPRRFVSVRRVALGADDVIVVRGLRVTSVARTLLDLAARMPVVETVVAIDTAFRLRLLAPVALDLWIALHDGTKGVRALRRAAALARAGAESPMETRLRLLLEMARLPTPILQAELSDAAGRFLARVDLYYPGHRLAIEYDGAMHRDMLIEDNRRQNDILTAGYRLLRFTASDVLGTPAAVVARVRAELGRRRAA